jgi:hypothetical protein
VAGVGQMIDKVKLGHLLPRLASFDGEVVVMVLASHAFARGEPAGSAIALNRYATTRIAVRVNNSSHHRG